MTVIVRYEVLGLSRGKQLCLPTKHEASEKCDCEAMSPGSSSRHLLSPPHLVPLRLTASSPQMIPVAVKVHVYFMSLAKL